MKYEKVNCTKCDYVFSIRKDQNGTLICPWCGAEFNNFKANKWIKRFVLAGNVIDFIERVHKLRPELKGLPVYNWSTITKSELNKIWREQNEDLAKKQLNK